jgi:hypothetical protein
MVHKKTQYGLQSEMELDLSAKMCLEKYVVSYLKLLIHREKSRSGICFSHDDRNFNTDST